MRMMDVASVQRALFQFQIKDYKKLFNDWDPIRNLVVSNKLERATKRHSVNAVLNVLVSNSFKVQCHGLSNPLLYYKQRVIENMA